MQRYLILNMKTYLTTRKDIKKIIEKIQTQKTISKLTTVVCPPMPVVSLVGSYMSKKKSLALGVQDVSSKDAGAHTGETPVELVRDSGVVYGIVGHSERRANKETNKDINIKIQKLLAHDITPIVCVGESVRDTSHQYLSVLAEQIQETFAQLSEDAIQKTIIAYEPVWAIGATAQRSATPEEAVEMSLYIRKVLHEQCGVRAYQDLRIVYGGSVTSANAETFLQTNHIQGLLVGRASSDPLQVQALMMAFT